MIGLHDFEVIHKLVKGFFFYKFLNVDILRRWANHDPNLDTSLSFSPLGFKIFRSLTHHQKGFNVIFCNMQLVFTNPLKAMRS